MTLIDSAELFYTVLSSDTGLTTLVGEQIYGPPGLPPDHVGLTSAVMFIGNGGDSNVNVPIGIEEFEVYCYGADAQVARAIYLAVLNALNRKKHRTYSVTGGTAIFQYAIKQTGPQDRVDPAEGWPFTYASFELHFIELRQ